LTLIFLGEIEEAALPRLLEAVESGAQTTPFSVTLAKPGAFPDSGPASVLWVGVTDPHGDLRNLVDSLGATLRRYGFPLEERPFIPHLTLGRCTDGGLKGRKVLGELAITPLPLTVDRIVVFRSERGSEGARHIPLEVIKLTGAEG
jgi:2'-5' RNA ligase